MDRNKISKLISYPFPLIFHAARKENIKFLRKLTDKRPDILWEVDERKQTIFHVAVYNGQEKIVQLLSEMRSQNDPRVFLTDKNGNTILHLAAMVQGNDVDVSKSKNDNSNNDGSNVIFEQLSNCNNGYAGLRWVFALLFCVRALVFFASFTNCFMILKAESE